MKQVLKSVLLAAAAAASLTSAAFAGDRPANLRVAHGDLDLSRPADASVFKARVDTAVSAWCRDNAGLFSGRGSINGEGACRAHAAELVQMSTPSAQKRALKMAAAASVDSIEVAAR